MTRIRAASPLPRPRAWSSARGDRRRARAHTHTVAVSPRGRAGRGPPAAPDSDITRIACMFGAAPNMRVRCGLGRCSLTKQPPQRNCIVCSLFPYYCIFLHILSCIFIVMSCMYNIYIYIYIYIICASSKAVNICLEQQLNFRHLFMICIPKSYRFHIWYGIRTKRECANFAWKRRLPFAFAVLDIA